MLYAFHFTLRTLESRFEALPRIHEAIGGAGAWVTNFHAPLAASACLELEVPARELPVLHGALQVLGMGVEPGLEALLEFFHRQITEHPDRCLAGSVNVRFLGPDEGLPGILRPGPG